MNYLDYLETGNKINWFTRPINVDKHPVKSSWMAIFSDLIKRSKDDDEKTPVESNKNTSNNSGKSGNNHVIHINIDREHPYHLGSVGRVKYSITTKYNS